MDIVDLMNLTRAQWSTDLGCCLDRKQPEWFFLVSSCIFAFLPLTFYLAAFVFTTRKEQTVLKRKLLTCTILNNLFWFIFSDEHPETPLPPSLC